VAQPQPSLHLDLIADIVSAYVSNNPVPLAELPGLIGLVSQSLGTLTGAVATPEIASAQKPAVPIKKSITPDYIICLEDGARYRSMKMPLMKRFGMTPDQYRQKWALPPDYPMVAPNYSAVRSAAAKKIGLGRKPEPEPVARGRRKTKPSSKA
jgi:predicted transcriptional regulator